MQKYLLSDEAQKANRESGLKYCFAIVSCSRDSKLTQRFLQYERDHTELTPMEAQSLYNLILCLKEKQFRQGEYVNQGQTMPFVRVYSSPNVGSGIF